MLILRFSKTTLSRRKVYGSFLSIFLMLSGFIQVSGQEQTIWGPGEGYQLAYIHSGKVIANGSSILNFDNLPVTDFLITKIKRKGVNYFYTGYGNNTFSGSLNLQEVNTSNEILYYPTGSLPIVLPLSFNGQQDWVSNFEQSFDVLTSNIPDRQDLFSLVSSSISGQRINFKGNFSFDPLWRSPFFFSFLPILDIENLDTLFTYGTVTILFSYNTQTGVMFDFILSVSTWNYTDSTSTFYRSIDTLQSLEFVAIIPPIVILNEILTFRNLFILVLFIAIVVIKRNRF